MNYYIKRPEPADRFGRLTTFGEFVEHLAYHDQRLTSSAAGLHAGGRLVQACAVDDDPIIEIDDRAYKLLRAATEAPSNGYVALRVTHPKTGETQILQLGPALIPHVDAILEATKEPPAC